MPSLTSGIPQSSANPLLDFIDQGPEMAEQHRRDMEDWRARQTDTLDRAALDPDAFYADNAIDIPGLDPAHLRRATTVRSYLTLANDGKPVTGDLYPELFRQRIARERFDGRGADSDESFFTEIQKEAQGRKDSAELAAQMTSTAITGTLLQTTDEAGMESMSFDLWRQEAKGKPGYRPGMDFAYREAWNETRQQVKANVEPYLGPLKDVWQGMRAGSADWYAAWEQVPEESRGEFMASLALLARALPAEEQPTFWGNVLKQSSRDLQGQAINVMEGLGDAINTGSPLNDYGDPFAEQAAATQDRSRKNFIADVERIRDETFDPVKVLNPDSTLLRTLERGSYAATGAIATSAVALVPYVGPAATYYHMEESAYRDMRRSLMDGGMTDQAASDLAQALAPAIAVPQAALERIGAGALVGKLPGLEKVLAATANRITSTAGRFAARTGAIAGFETAIENTQDLIPALLQDAASALSQDVPGVTWRNGKDGFFDGYWEKTATTAVAILPLAIIGGAGGISAETRRQAFAAAPDLHLRVLGIPADGVARIREAQAAGNFQAEAQIATELGNLDPRSEDAKDATQELAENLQAQKDALAAAQRTGVMPTFYRSADGWSVRDGESGAEIGTSTTADGALRLAMAHTSAIEEDNADQIAALATLLEAGDVVAGTDQEGVRQTATDLRPGQVVTTAQQAAQSEQDEIRIRQQTEARERLGGSDGGTARMVLGQSVTETRQKVRNTVNRINAGGSVLTVFHESNHGFFREALATGRLTRDETLAAIRAIETVLAGKTTKEGDQLVFLSDPETFAGLSQKDQDAELDEAVSELLDAEILRTRKTGTRKSPGHKIPPGLVTRNLTAMARLAPGAAAKLRDFIAAVRAFWGLTFQRAAAIKAAIREGTLDETQLDAFKSKLFGLEDQTDLEQAARDTEARILDGELLPETQQLDGDPFSLGPRVPPAKPYKERDGSEQGEPLTETEIREGIEDEPGTLGDVEIDDDLFSDPDLEGPAFSIQGPAPLIDRASLSGKKKFIYFSDRTRVGVYTGLDPASGIAIDLQGGPAYPYIAGHGTAPAGWAFTTQGMFTRFQKRVDGGDGIGLTTLYSKENLRANPTFLLAYVAEVNHAIATKKLTKTAFLAEANRLRDAAQNAKSDGQPVIPPASDAGKLFSKKWKSVDDFQAALSAATFEIRAGMFFGYDAKKKGANKGSKIGGDKLVAAGFPNISDMVDLFTDPAFADMPAGTIVGAVEFEKGQTAASAAADIGAENHLSYPVVTKGKGLGFFKDPVLVTDVIKHPTRSGREITRSAETSMAEVSFSLGRPLPQTAANIIALAKELDPAAFKAAMEDTKAYIQRRRDGDIPLGPVLEADQVTLAAQRVLVPFVDKDPRALAMLKDYGADQFSSYSLGPAALADLLGKDAVSRIKDPVRRAQAMSRIAREMEAARLQFERLELVAGSKRLKKSLEREASIREALRREELENEAMARHWQVLSDDDLVKIKSQPAHALLSDPTNPLRGRIQSRTATIRQNPDLYTFTEPAEYNGSETVSRAVFGGTLTPDQAVEELVSAGLLREGSTADDLWDLLNAEARSVSNRKRDLEIAKQELREARTQAKDETNVWLREQGVVQETTFSDKQEILRALGVLDGILSSVPAEIRGKIGGYTQLARIASNEAKLSFLKDRLAKVDVELEKYLRDQFDREFRALLDRAKPEKDEAGKKPRGKITPTIHALFRAVEDAMTMSGAEVEAEAARLESLANSGDYTAEEENHLNLTAGMILLAGNWAKASAASREAALIQGSKLFEAGYMARKIELSKQRERRAKTADTFQTATKATGDDQIRRDTARKQDTRRGAVSAVKANLLSFEGVLQEAFGLDSPEVEQFVTWERHAANAKQDALQHKYDLLDDLLASLAGGKFKGEQLRAKLQDPDAVTWTDWKGRKQSVSELQAVHMTMMYRQEDGRRHMEGHLDEVGKPIGDWHYRPEDMAAIEDQLSDNAKAIRVHLSETYAAEWERINAVFEQNEGISLPRHKLYAPVTVDPAQAQANQMLDPTTGNVASPSFTSGSLRNRSQTAIAKPNFDADAIQVYLGHVRQMEHYIAYSTFAREMMAVTNRREVRDAIKETAGPELQKVLGKYLDYFATGSVMDPSTMFRLNRMMAGMMNRFAAATLVGRVSVLAIQSTQLLAAWSYMPTGAYLSRLGRLMAGRLDWSGALKSDYIQRRKSQMPATIQQLMEGLRSAKPSRLIYTQRKMGETIAGADALFTAGTFAITYDYHLDRAKKQGMTGQQATDYALEQAEAATDRVAQPVRPGTRSILEITSTNPAFKMLWNFASDARQKLAIAAFQHSDRTPMEKARALGVVWLAGGIVSTLIRSAMRDIRDDGEDDEIFDERNWDPARLGLQSLTGPLGGLPYIGDAIESAIFAAAGEYLPSSGTPLDNVEKAVIPLKRLITGDIEGAGQAMKDGEAILSAGALADDRLSALNSLSHVARDLFGIMQNVTGD
jgi:hypothetical protein